MSSVFSRPLVTPCLRLLATAALRLSGWKTSLAGSPPFGALMRWLGGIAVDRSHSTNVVTAVAQTLKQQPELVLCIAPEGTRKKVDRWRTGFYYIALEAQVPIVMAAFDAKAREVRFLGQYLPTGDAEREIGEIQRRYGGIRGIIPENAFELQDQQGANPR